MNLSAVEFAIFAAVIVLVGVVLTFPDLLECVNECSALCPLGSECRP